MPALLFRVATFLGTFGLGAALASKDDNQKITSKPNIVAQLIPHLAAFLCAKFLFTKQKMGKEFMNIDLSRIIIYIVAYLVAKSIVDQVVIVGAGASGDELADPNTGTNSNFDPSDLSKIDQLKQDIAAQQAAGHESSYPASDYGIMADQLLAAMNGCGVTDDVFPNVFSRCNNDLDVYNIIDAFGLQYVTNCAWTNFWIQPTSDTPRGLGWHMVEEGVDVDAVNAELDAKNIEFKF